MPIVSSPVSTTQTYIPAVSQSQLGRYAGLHMHFATLSALNTAVTDERTNITNSSAIWSDGQKFTVATEAGSGTHRSWNASAQHARTIHIAVGKTVTLAADSNTVLASAGTPSSGVGSNGDLAIDTTNGLYYVKSAGAWGTGTPVSAMPAADIITAINTQLGGTTWQTGGGASTLSGISDMSANARTFNAAANYTAMRAALGVAPGTDVQAYNAALASIAGLTTSANQGIYTTGANTYATYTVTAAGRTIAGAADASAQRTALGLVIGTDVQAFNAKLGAISGLTATADSIAYFTGASTAAIANFTAGGRALVNSAGTANTFPYFSSANTVTLGSITAAGLALLDDADASAQRTTLGLAIGTNVQAYNAALASIAGLTTSANQGIYATGSNTYATFSLTAAGRALLDDADAAAQLTTLGAQTAVQFQDETSNLGTAGTVTTVNFTGAGVVATRSTNTINVTIPGATSSAPVVENIATGSAYTLVSGDAQKIKRGVDTNPQTINITTAFNGLGCTIQWPAGSGTITLDAGTGVNLNGLGDGVNITLSQAGGAVEIIPTGTNTFDVVGAIGDLVAADITNATATGISLVTATDAAAARTTLGLVIGTNVQAFNANLGAIAGLTSAADTLGYFTGSGTAGVTTLTAGGRALINSAGTANTFPYFSASNTITLGSITAAGRALLDDADATAQLTTLGLSANARSFVTAADYSAMRTAISLVPGTDVQGFNAYLQKIAAATPREITGATTLIATDVDCVIRANAASTFVITLANDATLTPVAGKSSIAIYIKGAGVPTIAAGTATLVGSPRSGLAQGDTIVLMHTGDANTWAYV